MHAVHQVQAPHYVLGMRLQLRYSTTQFSWFCFLSPRLGAYPPHTMQHSEESSRSSFGVDVDRQKLQAGFIWVKGVGLAK